MIRVLQALSEAGGAANEDLICCEPDLLMLLDGSTSLIPTDFDARRFTRGFAEGMRAHAELALPERVNRALEYTEALYRQSGAGSGEDFYPSAAGIFVQERSGWLEILAVGDCTGLFFTDEGLITVTDDRVKRLDDGVLARCAELAAREGKSVAELVKSEEIRRLLLANRRKMNRPDGYKILSFEMPPCTDAGLIRLRADRVRRIVLHSDGFDAVAEDFLAPELSLEEIYEKLRRAEALDPGFEAMPRFKPGDDASALVAELAEN